MPVAAADPIPPGLRPLRFPEFGNIEFGWGVCRNSMCPNFGVLYGSEDGPGSYELRYRLVREGGKLTKLKCRLCGLTIPLYSASGIFGSASNTPRRSAGGCRSDRRDSAARALFRRVRSAAGPDAWLCQCPAQIQEHYRGDDDLPLTELLQSASAVLASHGHAWPDGLDGLLLIEMESLLYWGHVDATVAARLVYRLPEVRRDVIRAFRRDPEVAEGRYEIDAVDVADTLAEVHWRSDGLALDSEMTVMGLRATAMAMTFAQLLSQTLFLSPVQLLRPWVETGNAR